MNNVNTICPTIRRAPLLDADNAAIAWLFRHAKHLPRVDALEGCIDHLMTNHDMPERAAEIAAIQAYAECNSVSQAAAIDVAATTAHVVVLRTIGDRPVMFTADDLMRLLEQARIEGTARVVNSHTRSPVVITQ